VASWCPDGQCNLAVAEGGLNSRIELALDLEPFEDPPIRSEMGEWRDNNKLTKKERRIMKKLTTAFGALVGDTQDLSGKSLRNSRESSVTKPRALLPKRRSY